ncbi:Crp/Fnr family transcriptional regulator [Stappia indica]|uniref:Crp/Fnr family transcriptional regulator n=1 Tax=Stappia indica TaxID=538381 RepID=UPI001CD39B46|nr:Crp/Fnr family transcriptional regulator [Stappia indica]MCA1297321.1 Crp/Fnr family transcriptional regulator [Stappia indica]
MVRERGGILHSCVGCGLAQVPWLANVPAETLQELAAICRRKSFRAGETVAREGEAPDRICCVVKGILRMQKTLGDGRQHIVGLLFEGDIFGSMDGGSLAVSIEAASDAEVCAFQREPFKTLVLRSPALGQGVLVNLRSELERARDWMAILAIPKVRGRLAGFLLALCSRFGGVSAVKSFGHGTFEVKIPISRADQANLLGARPESISRAYHALADDGKIAILRPDLIEIRNIEALAAEADEGEMDARDR